MMDGIVEKIRSLNMVFGKSATTVIPLDALCQKLCKILGCNIYLFDNAGHIFACAVAPAFLCPYIECSLLEKELPGYYMERFNSQDQSIVGLYEENPKCTYGCGTLHLSEQVLLYLSDFLHVQEDRRHLIHSLRRSVLRG